MVIGATTTIISTLGKSLMTTKLFAILVLSVGCVSSVYADTGGSCPWYFELLHLCTPGGHGGGPTPAPEIDPASAMSALALLAGGLAVLRGRSLKKK
jgi:hypothetical protein